MQAAGVNLGRAFQLLGTQSEDKSMARVATAIGQKVSQGSPLSSAFAAHRDTFSVLHVRMLQIGERTGTLHVALAELSEHEEKHRSPISL